MIDQISHI